MKKALILMIATLACATPGANEDAKQQLEKEIMATVNRFLHAVNTADTALMEELIRPEAMTYARIQESHGKFTTKARQQAHFLEDLRQDPQYYERIWDPVILVDEQIAAVWAQYDFYVGGEFSHCGTDLFTLVRENGAWKIANSVWTVVKVGCPPSPLGEISD
ncbi:MAG: nuclear transport factor 2 family protein [Pseudomonadota bacterium]